MDNADDEVKIIAEDEAGEETVRKLRERVKRLQEERDEYLAGWQRAKADFINARKDEEKSRAEFLKFAERGLIEKMLRIADNFDMAFAGNAPPDTGANWISGIRNIRSQLLKILEEHGVAPIQVSAGERFNPAEHEAIEKTDVPDQARDGMITEVVQTGYKLHDKILRPAMVKVGVYKG